MQHGFQTGWGVHLMWRRSQNGHCIHWIRGIRRPNLALGLVPLYSSGLQAQMFDTPGQSSLSLACFLASDNFSGIDDLYFLSLLLSLLLTHSLLLRNVG